MPEDELYQIEVVIIRIFGRHVDISRDGLNEVRRAIIEEVRKQELAGEVQYKKGGK